MDINQIVLSVVDTILGGLAIVLVRYVVGVAKSHLTMREQELIENLAIQAVRFAEESGLTAPLTGSEKLTKASEWLVAQAARYQIALDENEVEQIVLSALQKMRDEFAATWGK